MQREDQINVKMLGEFMIEYAGNCLTETEIRSNQIIKLLTFLLINRERMIPLQELFNALWGEEEIENPTGALKNLVYRLRNVLKKIGNQKYILYVKGSYCWNPELPVNLDCETFENKCNQAQAGNLALDERIRIYEEALELYQGVLLPKFDVELWVIPLATYYYSRYLTASKELASLYYEKGNYQALEELTRKTLKYDNLDEELHYWVIKGLLGQNKVNLALDYYREAQNLLYRGLGIRTSEKLDEVYEEILSMENVEISNMEDIYRDIFEKSSKGVFICEYTIFREIFRLETRRVKRMGVAEYVLLFSIYMVDALRYDKKQLLVMLKKNMSRFEEILKKSLREGDVVTRCSDTQYVVLLPVCNYENGTMVAERIKGSFYREYGKKHVSIEYELKEIFSQREWKETAMIQERGEIK